MAAFYSSTDFSQNELTVNHSKNKPFAEPLIVNESQNGLQNREGMETVPVAYTTAEKELLEKQAIECKTVLPKLIRIRSLMEETDIRQMQLTLSQQKDEIEELRSKLGFYQNEIKKTTSVERITDKKVNCLQIEMTERQFAFLKEKYMESYDFEDDMSEQMPDKSYSSNQKEIFEVYEKTSPGYIVNYMQREILNDFILKIQDRLVEHCFYSEEDFEDEMLIDEFDELD